MDGSAAKPPPAGGGESPGSSHRPSAPPEEHLPPGSLRVAVTSSGSSEASPLLRIVAVALIVVSGLALYLTRAALAPVIERVAPALARGSEEQLAAEPEPAVEPQATAEAAAEEPSGPQLTYEEIETMLVPLPERLLALIGEGRSELPEFSALSSSDDFQTRRIRSQWQNWGRIWRNRVGVVEGEMPPAEECRIHAALEPTCAMLREAVEILRALPSAERIDEAREHLDRATAVIEDFLQALEETATEEAAAEETEALGEDATAEGFQVTATPRGS